jgi:SAM-dependent methyltransferase
MTLPDQMPNDPNAEQAEMFSYYDAQADSYEDFYRGRGQAIAALSSEYPVDTAGVSELLSGFGRGDVVDLACGTAFWLPAYGANCNTVTLVDQSAAALARCQQRVRELNMHRVARVIRADLFHMPLAPARFDAGVVGFLLSHLADGQTAELFDRLRDILRPKSTLAIIDSAWSEARHPHGQRDGFMRRLVGDGRSFMIRKKYFDRADLGALLGEHGFRARSVYAGNVFIAVVAERVV